MEETARLGWTRPSIPDWAVCSTMGGCGSTGKVTTMNPDEIDITHFSVERTLGRGGFGKVNAITKLSNFVMNDQGE